MLGTGTAGRSGEGTAIPQAHERGRKGQRRAATRVRRARAERTRLAETYGALYSLVQSAPVAVIALDTNRQVVFWNPAAERLFGWSAGELIGRTVPIVPDDRRAESAEITRRIVQGEAVVGIDTLRQRKDGSLVDVRLAVAPLRDRRGMRRGSVAMIEDITDTARLRNVQAERAAELEALFALSGRLRAAQRPEDMYPILVAEVIRLVHADAARLALLGPSRQDLVRVYVVGLPETAVGQPSPLEGTVSGQVVASGIPFVTEDVTALDFQNPGGLSDTLVPLVVVPVRSEHEVMGTLGVFRRGDGRGPFTEAEVRLIQGIAEMGGTALRRARLYRNLEDSYMEMVMTLARTVDARDAYTGGHSERSAAWAEAVARDLGRPGGDTVDIRWGALLHDIGKLGVPDEILRKPGPLAPEEWEVMRRHPVIGEEILRSADRMRTVARIVRSHQEHWDGTGYPDRLAGEEIPLGARIVAVVDAFSAMTSDRPYRAARAPEAALQELRRRAGTQFDPAVVEVFCRIMEAELAGARPERARSPEGALRREDAGQAGLAQAAGAGR